MNWMPGEHNECNTRAVDTASNWYKKGDGGIYF